MIPLFRQKKAEHMETITFQNILRIILGSLNKIDNNLVGHGERVAYVVLRLLEPKRMFSNDELGKIGLIVLLHDIGGWEKKNISDLLRIENEERFSHAQYGYVFIKHFTPFPQYAPIVLHHHSSCRMIDHCVQDQALRTAIKQIRVADAADLLLLCQPDIDQRELSAKLYHLCESGELDGGAVAGYMKLLRQEETVFAAQAGRRVIQSLFLEYMEHVSISEHEQERLLQTIVSAIDFRSRYTVFHCATMLRVCGLLADFCGVDSNDRNTLHYGAMFHDLGKIAIPTHILESRGKLHGKEWEVMKSHVSITGEILEGNVDDKILQIAIRHHEAMDGSGYPRGLTGEQLTLMQRIVIVSDVISALAGKRSYKEPFSLNRIKQILNEMKTAGKLCPYVTDIALEHCEQIYFAANEVGRAQQKVYHNIQQEYERMRQSTNQLAKT